MKIKLKKDWDTPIQPPFLEKRIIGHFAGRKKEIELLSDEILHKVQGSILVSGYRGVGKTSTVYKALSEAKNKERNLLIILMNAAQLEAESTRQSQIAPEKIIQNLIRRLYSTAKDSPLIKEGLKQKIETIYRKAVASEFKLKESYQRQAEILSEIKKEESTEILLSEKNIRIMIFIVSWVFATIFQVFPLTSFEWVNKLLPLILAFPAPFAINLLYKKHKIQRTKEEVKGEAEELYEFDNSIGNLEFDLEEIHKEVYNNGIKLVYVIDELDKLDPAQVVNVLKFFKNLFTLSKALFIFVGGEDIFLKTTSIPSQQQESYRSKEYTYFTSKYFLARPLWKDLNEYLDEIVELKEMDDDTFEKLKHSLAFDAKNDFFDLIGAIKDRITKFDDDGFAIIEMNRLNDEDILKFRFHKSITTVFEDKYLVYLPSKWYENEMILRNLFFHANNLFSNYSGYQFSDDERDSPIASAIRDFNGFLYRLGAFNIIAEKQQNIRGLTVPIRTYQYAGGIAVDPPSKLDEPSEIEKRFLSEFERYIKYIISLNNMMRVQQGQIELTVEDFWKNPTSHTQQINSWGFDAINHFNTHYPVYNNLTSMKPPYPYRREEIEQRTNQLQSHTNTMLSNIHIILAHVIRTIYPALNLQIQQLFQNGNLFSGSAAQIRNVMQSYANYVVFKPDYSRQVLIVSNQSNIIKSLKKIIEDNAETHTVVSIVANMEEFKIKGCFEIEYETAEKLASSGKKLLDYMRKFLGE